MAHKLPLADIQFIADFAAFCRSKGDEAYDYGSHDNCACAQFLKATGRARSPDVYAEGWFDDDKAFHDFSSDLEFALVECSFALDNDGRNFRDLADRLEALIADAPTPERAQ